MNSHSRSVIVVGMCYALAATISAAQTADPLPSWNEGKAKQAIV